MKKVLLLVVIGLVMFAVSLLSQGEQLTEQRAVAKKEAAIKDCKLYRSYCLMQNGMACSTGMDGQCNEGVLECICNDQGCEESCRPRLIQDEICNGRDDNCDGEVDEGCFGQTTTLSDRDVFVEVLTSVFFGSEPYQFRLENPAISGVREPSWTTITWISDNQVVEVLLLEEEDPCYGELCVYLTQGTAVAHLLRRQAESTPSSRDCELAVLQSPRGRTERVTGNPDLRGFAGVCLIGMWAMIVHISLYFKRRERNSS